MWLENSEQLERNAIRSGLAAGPFYRLSTTTAPHDQAKRRQASSAVSLTDWIKDRLFARG